MSEKGSNNLKHPTELVKANLQKYRNEDRRKVVLIATGAYNPVHRMHLEVFLRAKEFLENEQHNFLVVGGFVSPSHDQYVSDKLKSDFINSKDRLKMIKLGIQELGEDSWLIADPWESSQTKFIGFPKVTKSLDQQLQDEFPLANLKVIFLCGADLIIRCGGFTKVGSNSVVVVGRAGYNELLQDFISKSPNGHELYYVILEKDDISSTLIRERLKEGKPIMDLTFRSVETFLQNKGYYKPINSK